MISEIVWTISGGIFDVADKETSLEDINNRLSDESTWSNLELSQSLNKEKADIEFVTRVTGLPKDKILNLNNSI